MATASRFSRLRRRCLSAWRSSVASEDARLLLLEHAEWRDRGGSDRGNERGEQRRAAEYGYRPQVGGGVPRADLKQETCHQPPQGERTRQSQNKADRDQPQ